MPSPQPAANAPTPNPYALSPQMLAAQGAQGDFNRQQEGLDFNQKLQEQGSTFGQNLLQQDAGFNQGLDQFGQFYNKYFPGSGGGGSTTSVVGGAGGGPITQVPGMGTVGTWTPTMPPPVTMASPQSTSGAAFARAKDQVGGSMQGLMKAMGDQFSTRGIGGSSVAANAVGNTLLGGEQQLGEVARDHAITDTNTANDFAKTQYQGGIDQRNQDIALQGQQLNNLASQRSAATTMRGQDISAADAAASLKQTTDQNRMAALTGLWSAFNKGSSGGVLY